MCGSFGCGSVPQRAFRIQSFHTSGSVPLRGSGRYTSLSREGLSSGRGMPRRRPAAPVFPGHGSGQHTLILQIRAAGCIQSQTDAPTTGGEYGLEVLESTSPVEMGAHVGSFSCAEISPPRKRITTRNRPVPSEALIVGLCPTTDGRGRLAAAHPGSGLRVRNEGSPSKLCLHTAEQCLPPTDL